MVQGPRGTRRGQNRACMAPCPSLCLLPQVLQEMCKQGYRDGLRFLRKERCWLPGGWVGSAWLSPVGQPAAALLGGLLRSPHPGLLEPPNPLLALPQPALPPRMPTQRRAGRRGLRKDHLPPPREDHILGATCPPRLNERVGGGGGRGVLGLLPPPPTCHQPPSCTHSPVEACMEPMTC